MMLLQSGKLPSKDELKKFYDYVLMTIHRPSNTGNINNLSNIFNAITQSQKKFVFPIHPRTRKILNDNHITLPLNLEVVEPFSYFEMITVLQNCSKVLTDSGGLQKEAYWMKKPCITLRNETEWIETLHNDWNILTGADTFKIQEALEQKINPSTWKILYGDGNASSHIALILKQIL